MLYVGEQPGGPFMRRVVLSLLLLPLLSGCIATAIASTAVSVVTLPVKAASKTVDVLTTSQSEADRNRGRRERKQEARDAKERKKAEQEQQKREREAAREARRS